MILKKHTQKSFLGVATNRPVGAFIPVSVFVVVYELLPIKHSKAINNKNINNINVYINNFMPDTDTDRGRKFCLKGLLKKEGGQQAPKREKMPA